MRPSRCVTAAAIALLASVAVGQQPIPEVQRVIVAKLPHATPDIRSIAVVLNLDLNHDQYLSEDEVGGALNQAQQSIENRNRSSQLQNHREGSWIHNGPSSSGYSSFKHRRVRELNIAWREMADSGYELSLVNEEFHRLFAELPGEQRSALLEADVDGDNNGMVTAREFYSHTRRVMRRKTRFEADFGEEAYLEVLRLFGVLE